MAATVITAPELHEADQDFISSMLLKYVPLFREHMDRGAGDLIGDLESIIDHRLWERVGYDSLEAYAREHLKHSEKWCREVVRIYRQDWTPAQRETGTVKDIVSAAETMRDAPELKPTGRPKGEKVANGYLSKNPNSKDRLAARIKRDHPEIAARVEAGEYRSIRAAALDAGIVRPMKSIPVDSAESAVRALVKVFDVQELLAAVGRIADEG